MTTFKNMTYLDFSNKAMATKQRKAIEEVRKNFGKQYPNYVDGKKIYTKKKTTSINPANPKEVVGVFQKAGQPEAEKAIKAAAKAFETWKNVPAKERANYLFKAAKVMKRRRYEINAWMISEVGKNYLEADADTCEAIDFLEFYAREAIRYTEKQPLTPYPGENNDYFYIPLGVGVVIPPWNFPMAILAGMTTAAIVAGNTVVLKPSSDSPMMGQLLNEIMQEVGLPKGVLNFLVASGAEAGDYLVQHPQTRFIAFTGSMEVGLRIVEKANQFPQKDPRYVKKGKDQIWIKRVINEMGGKDAIIVDSEANIDEAVQGVVTSAFGFQGQKCSACSRAIVDKAIYKEFNEKLKVVVEALKIGEPMDNVNIGPVVNKGPFLSILEYIEIGKKEGKLLVGGNKVKGLSGYFIEPTVFTDIKPSARLAQEEVFGPVLAVIKANNYDHALKIANDTIYGLTGGVYSLNKEKIERARNEFHVGNLYFNRKCTGALVDVQPFGGFNMSGTDSKAGGRDYLLQFMQGKSVAEKIVKYNAPAKKVAAKKKASAKKSTKKK
jgi:1-pyrroline-5-carboxylate dehydrogenase